MLVVRGKPPMFDQIDAVFNVKGRKVLFCWGETIYDPEGAGITPALFAHERVHCARQKALGDISNWWHAYLYYPGFRLAEEIPAHQAEFRHLCKTPDIDKPINGFRSGRAFHLLKLAQRLSSPLYGGLISLSEAKQVVGA